MALTVTGGAIFISLNHWVMKVTPCARWTSLHDWFSFN